MPPNFPPLKLTEKGDLPEVAEALLVQSGRRLPCGNLRRLCPFKAESRIRFPIAANPTESTDYRLGGSYKVGALLGCLNIKTRKGSGLEVSCFAGTAELWTSSSSMKRTSIIGCAENSGNPIDNENPIRRHRSGNTFVGATSLRPARHARELRRASDSSKCAWD